MAFPETNILISNADQIITMNPDQGVLEGASVYISGGVIQQVGETQAPAGTQEIDGRGLVVVPGLINTHHHLFQGMLKGFPDIQNKPIDEWVARVCDVAGAMTPEMVKDAALLNLAELALYGCTTTTDMAYVQFDRSGLVAPAVAAAEELGIRLHSFVGGISQTEQDGALFPDRVRQTTDDILGTIMETAAAFNNPEPLSVVRVGAALCNLFTNSTPDFRLVAELSEDLGVHRQTHLAESMSETQYALARYGLRPLALLRSLGWVGRSTSLVHGIQLVASEIDSIAESGMSVVHCPISNARSSVGERGIAHVSEMLQAGVNVAAGVDGSAGNDSSNLLEELRWARTVGGVRTASTYLDPATVMDMGTMAGARLLGREQELGSLEPGKAADLALFDLNSVEGAGSWDPATALLATQARRAHTVLINGRVVVENSRLTRIDEANLVSRVQGNLRRIRSSL